MSSFIAKRLDSFDSGKIRAAFELAADIPNQIDLSIGFPEDNTPNYIKRAAVAAIKDNHTRYTPSNGIIELREAIASKLVHDNKIAATAEKVTVTPGLTTAILLAYLATLNPGDEVLVPEPYFPPYKDLATMVGAVPKLIDTFPSFQLTAAMIEPLITKRTKALAINSPNNPSGAVYPRAELEKIAALAKKHKLLIISDEVYEFFAYDEGHFSIGSIYPNTLTLNGFSKSYAMTGWRVGYICGPEDIIEAINELQQYIVFSSSSIGQYAALEALKKDPKKITAKYKSKRDKARSVLSRSFSEVQGAQGAFYFFLQLPGKVNDLKFVNHLAHRGVIVLPGSAFSRREDHFRISYAVETDNLLTGLSRVGESVTILTTKHRL